ncbi:MAG TPA: hypothetical protein VFW29_05235 [Solirubrobacteraceae bacterium]|nr:hypothetical protein [Solirubrobacteraceae bacterium]
MGRLGERLRDLKRSYGGSDNWRENATGSLRERLRSRDPIKLVENDSSTTLLVAFGGMRGEFGMPFFEFSTLTENFQVKRLFLRDLRQAWYHRGMPGHGDSLLDVAAALRRLVDAQQPERLIVAGNSAGGYAALVFGTLLGAERVLCFSPQTVIDPDELAAIGDHRWDDRVEAVLQARALDRTWADLRTALGPARVTDTRYELYFGDGDLLDRAHAERLAGVDGMRLYRMGEGEHFVVRKMRNSGALEHVLRRALFPAPETVPR